MKVYLVRARAFWAQRNPRERVFLAVCSAVVVFGIVYGLLWAPLIKANDKLTASLPKQRAELRLVRVQASEIERLRSSRQGAVKSGSALIHAIESAAAAHGVREALNDLSAVAGNRVRVVTGPISVVTWLAWFTDLEQQGVSVVTCRVSTDGKPGTVSVEAMLSGGGA